MSTRYQESQARIDEAEAALREGDKDRASMLYREAAKIQIILVDSLPADRVRTKAIFGLSAATLLYRAGDIDDAKKLAHRLLEDPGVDGYCGKKLRALVDQAGRGGVSRT